MLFLLLILIVKIKVLSMHVTSPDGGELQIKIPKTFLDSISQGEANVTISAFTVLIDGVKQILKKY